MADDRSWSDRFEDIGERIAGITVLLMAFLVGLVLIGLLTFKWEPEGWQLVPFYLLMAASPRPAWPPWRRRGFEGC